MTDMLVFAHDVHMFITDGASVIEAAINSLIDFYPNAQQFVCLSHILNNCGRASLSCEGLCQCLIFHSNINVAFRFQ